MKILAIDHADNDYKMTFDNLQEFIKFLNWVDDVYTFEVEE